MAEHRFRLLVTITVSLIPPAFGKLISVITLHSDKDRDTSMLWQASTFYNISGTMAEIITHGYYDNLVGFPIVYSIQICGS